MKKTFFVLFAVFCLTNTNLKGQTFNMFYGQPLIVLTEADHNLWVLGSDVPTFALYENGQIIFRKQISDKWRDYEYYEVKYDRQKIQEIILSLEITDSLIKQDDFIKTSNAFGHNTNILVLNFDKFIEKKVYGGLRYDEEAQKNTPKYFLDVFNNIINFNDTLAKKWFPAFFEVFVSETDFRFEKTIKWKDEWNDMNSSTTIQSGENMWSIYIHKKYYEDFLKFINDLKDNEADLEINGKSYHIYGYRFPFPNL